MNHLKLEYGKYLDDITEEIPQSDLMLSDSGVFSHRLESGEPSIPTLDSTTVAIRNIDENGVEHYGYEAFWEAQARTSGEGSTFPLELYFKAKIKDQTVFTGILNGVDYDRRKDVCTVTMSDFLRAFGDDKRVMFKGVVQENLEVLSAGTNNSAAITSLDDEDGNSIDYEKLTFNIEFLSYLYSGSPQFVSPLAVHAEINEVLADAIFDFPPSTAPFAGLEYFSEYRNMFVTIGKNTLLTKCRFIVIVSKLNSPNELFLLFRVEVLHLKNTANGVYTDESVNVFEPGRFLKDDNTIISVGDKFKVTFWDYDYYNNDGDILMKSGDFPETDAYIGGFSAAASGTSWQLDSSVSHSRFDVLTKMQTILDREVSAQFFDTIGSDTLFDFSAVDASLYRSCFWADAIIHGWINATPAQVLLNALSQTSCYATATPDGVIKFIPRYGFETTLAGGSYPAGTVTLAPDEYEPLDRVRYDRGYSAVEIETPVEIIPVMNVRSDETIKTKVNEDGIVTSSQVRINQLEVRAYRTFDSLQVPLQADIDALGMPLLRAEPADLTDFPSTAISQAQRYMQGKFYPRRVAQIAVNFEDHFFQLGDFIAIEDSTDEDFNGCWQVVEVTYDSTSPEILCKLTIEFRGVKGST